MPFSLCLFEDEYFARLHPLSLTRPAFDLRCGMASLREKITRKFPGVRLHLFCREYLADQVREANPGAVVNQVPQGRSLLVNGCFLVEEFPDYLPSADTVWKKNGRIAAALVSGERLAAFSVNENSLVFPGQFTDVAQQEARGEFINYPWELVHHNPHEIRKDFAYLNRGGQILGEIYPNVTLLREESIHVAKGAKVKPGVVLDAEDGPIYIDEGATIMANACLQGPVFVGAKSIIKMGAKIYEGTSIGEMCKVGGEVEESIIHGHSNKQHEGFLGHAYLGEWVNLGADSNNSDLKNNYSNVKVVIAGQEIDTGSLFAGLFMGDHAKCGINTMFNTGTVVGVMSNVFGAGYPDKFIPSFTWGGIENMETYALDRALEVARRVMARRKVTLSTAQEKMLRHVFELTAPERKY